MPHPSDAAEAALLAEIDGVDTDGLIFCSKAYALFDAVRSGPEGTSRLRMLRGQMVGRLIEEVLPLCRYVQEHYRAGRYLSVKWSSGSQSFDAIITQQGAMVEALDLPARAHVEVTGAMHPNEYLRREALEKYGFVFDLDGLERAVIDGEKTVITQPVGRLGFSHVEQFAGYLREAISRKTQKTPPYPLGSTLVVYCALNTVYDTNDWEMLMEIVRPTINMGPFREVYVYDTVAHRDRLFRPNWIGSEPM